MRKSRNTTDDTDDLLLQSYNRPEHKDRVDDSHGGVILYIKKGIRYKRRSCACKPLCRHYIESKSKLLHKY